MVSSSAAFGQTTITEQSIAAKLQGPFVLLRGMYDGDKLNFDAQGNLMGQAGKLPFALSAIRVGKVRLNGSELAIEGLREGLEFAYQANGAPGTVSSAKTGRKVEIQIVRDPQHPLGEAIDRVFSVGLDDAVAQYAPACWQPWLHYYLHPDDSSNDALFRSKPDPDRFKKPGVNPPRLIHDPDPDRRNTGTARERGFNGVTAVSLVVDQTGHPQHVVIVRPCGMGLDEAAVEAVKQYRFVPAKRDENPFDTEIKIEVFFRFR